MKDRESFCCRPNISNVFSCSHPRSIERHSSIRETETPVVGVSSPTWPKLKAYCSGKGKGEKKVNRSTLSASPLPSETSRRILEDGSGAFRISGSRGKRGSES